MTPCLVPIFLTVCKYLNWLFKCTLLLLCKLQLRIRALLSCPCMKQEAKLQEHGVHMASGRLLFWFRVRVQRAHTVNEEVAPDIFSLSRNAGLAGFMSSCLRESRGLNASCTKKACKKATEKGGAALSATPALTELQSLPLQHRLLLVSAAHHVFGGTHVCV